jgi:hypothetical protein
MGVTGARRRSHRALQGPDGRAAVPKTACSGFDSRLEHHSRTFSHIRHSGSTAQIVNGSLLHT